MICPAGFNMNEEREEPEKFSLVFYKEERLVAQISPPRTIFPEPEIFRKEERVEEGMESEDAT